MNRRMPNGMYGGVRGERKSPLLDLERRAESNNRKTDNAAENIRNYIVIRIGIYYNFYIIELRRKADENI